MNEMPTPSPTSGRCFRYEAVTATGERVSGAYQGESIEELRTELRARGALLIRAHHVPVLMAGAGRRLSLADLGALLRSFSVVLRAGIAARHAPAVLAPLVPQRCARCLPEIERRLGEGWSLTDALQTAANGLPMGLHALLTAGERAGALPPALASAAGVVEERIALRQAVVSALAYPVVLVVATLFVVLLLTGVVIPRFALLLTELGGILPPSTRLLLAVADSVRSLAPVGLTLLALAAALLARTWREPARRRRVHGRLLSLPVVGPIRHSLSSARAGSLLAAAVGAHLPLPDGLALAVAGADDMVVAARLSEVRRQLLEGRSLTQALTDTGALTTSMVRLIGIGELSGDLGTALQHATELEGAAARRRLASAVAVIQPALVVLLGALVTFVAVALLQAVYGVRPVPP